MCEILTLFVLSSLSCFLRSRLSFRNHTQTNTHTHRLLFPRACRNFILTPLSYASNNFRRSEHNENCSMKIYFYFHLLGYFPLLHHYSLGFSLKVFLFFLPRQEHFRLRLRRSRIIHVLNIIETKNFHFERGTDRGARRDTKLLKDDCRDDAFEYHQEMRN